MADRIAYVDGEFVPESRAVVSVFDRGWRWGDAVYDVERTFRGKLFKLEQHIDRLYRSLRYTRIDPGMSKEEMIRVTQHVMETNREFLGEDEDYQVTQVVSRGVSSIGRRLTGFRATVTVCCQLIHFHDFARSYFNGAAAVTPSIRRTPPQCLSPKAKISNKMNHILAEFEAREGNPEAVPLMLDLDGYITENSGGNFLFVSGGRVMMPDSRGILPGISMETTLELVNSQGLPIVEGLYTPHDVYCADEAFLTTTSYCILPVSSLNGIRIGSEVPGPVTRSLLTAWSKLVGVDIVGQAVSFLPPEEMIPARFSKPGSGLGTI